MEVVTPIVELRNLQLAYQRHVVVDVPHLEIQRGDTLAVIGPNGSGKSTLLRALALLERPARGEVWLDGERIAHGNDPLARRRRIALVLQQALLRRASVADNVATGLRFRGVPRAEQEKLTKEWMERLGIAHLAKRTATTLSGGEAQRASLARALVLSPELLLLDEPFASLDTFTKGPLIETLREILREVGVTTVLVTHDRSEALSLAHRVAVMLDGRLHQIDEAERVFNAPADPKVAAFVGVDNMLPGRVELCGDGLVLVSVGGQKLMAAGKAAPRGQRVLVCLRPEAVHLERVQGTAEVEGGSNRLWGTVTSATPYGFRMRVTVDCGFPLVSLVTREVCSELGLTRGSPVVASFRASALHLM